LSRSAKNLKCRYEERILFRRNCSINKRFHPAIRDTKCNLLFVPFECFPYSRKSHSSNFNHDKRGILYCKYKHC